MTLETAKFLVGAVTAVIAVVAFLIGLLQYRRAQLWRRKEFIGAEAKAFLNDPAVRNALLMIDWTQRRIPFEPAAERKDWPVVTRQLQISALRPHTAGRDMTKKELIEHSRKCAALGSTPPPDGVTEIYGFSETEARIRDTYDFFLDGLERLQSFAESGLFHAIELGPFLRYWFDDMASAKGPDDDLRWRLALFAYIQFYRFDGVQRLFAAFGHDITLTGPTWRSIRQHLASSELADQLSNLVVGADCHSATHPDFAGALPAGTITSP